MNKKRNLSTQKKISKKVNESEYHNKKYLENYKTENIYPNRDKKKLVPKI